MMRVLKWLGIAVVVLLVVGLLLMGILHLVGSSRLASAPEVEVKTVAVVGDAAAIEHGEYLANISSCTGCHGPDLSGTVLNDEPPIGYIPATNLTSGAGGIGDSYTAEDWARAIRHGVGVDGRTLVIMPSYHFAHYGDDDLADLIAYLQTIPSIDNDLGERNITFPGTIIFGMFAYSSWAVNVVDHASVGGNAPEMAATAEYGEYLVNITSCTSCHGENLAGNPDAEGSPMGPNLTQGGELANWSEADFMTTLRTGTTPEGEPLSEEMPWIAYSQMSDTELQALWLYLRSVPGLPDNTGE